jgi:hypothetical protein
MPRSAECEEGPELPDGRKTVKVRVILTGKHCNFNEPWNYAAIKARDFALNELGLSSPARRVTMTADVNVTDHTRIMAYIYTYAFDPKESAE